ncbi:MAG TPA: aldo/keto reductase [Chloroflexi bacterium]|nr:aldo/keto reductase [Chloroflexota bacterium]
MEQRKLGRTGLDVGVVGLGTEYLNGQPRDTVVATVREAIDRGVNYFDLVFSFPEYLDNLAVALEGRRERVILTGHLGSTEKDGQYHKSRSVKQSETYFLDLLDRLGTDYVDVLFLHNCNTERDYETLVKPNGIRDLALRLQAEGRARFIGFSGHSVPVALQAVESGHVDVVMFAVNLAANAAPGKRALHQACVAHGVGIVAMKPFAGGKLLDQQRTIQVAKYQTGGEALKLRTSDAEPNTPVRCISYALSQVGVCTMVPGCRDVDELRAALAYVEAGEETRDFSPLLAQFERYVEGECVYCNHCLPCPVHIDVGQVNHLLDAAGEAVSPDLQAAYDALPVRASECTACGACVERCPFGVDVLARIEQAVAVFEA